MKYIIIGLGNFGSSLATKLTAMGHEVIGVDSDMKRIEMVKDKVTHVVCLNSMDVVALGALPFRDADLVIVSIGEDFGASIMTSAYLKQIKVKRIISRALSPLHKTILEAIGIQEIIHPEEESAERLAKTIEMKDILDSFDLFEYFKVVEVKLPDRYVGKSIEEIDLRRRFNLNILTILKMKDSKNIFGNIQKKPEFTENITAKTMLEKNDIIVVFGKIDDIRKFLDAK